MQKTFIGATATGREAMTIQGTVNKTGLSLLILLFTASWVWEKVISGAGVPPVIWLGAIGGFIVAIIIIFKKEWAPVTTPIYSALEGLFLGGISGMLELRYPGIVIQAVALTFGTLFSLLMAYKSGLIKVTENFKLGIVAATGGICLIYFVNIIMRFFGSGIPFIHESGTFGILFSLFVVVIAALNLVLDFDFIGRVRNGAFQNIWNGMGLSVCW